jgi:hypothetical protein
MAVMNFAAIFKAVDAVVMIRDTARRYKLANSPAATTSLSPASPAAGPSNQIEATLTNVVVAALKEAFDRDHARLELERAHIDEERRRSEQALRAELRRQAVDRELGRLRLLAGTAMVGWIASIVLFAVRLSSTSTPARVMVAAGWLLLLGALAAAFTAQPKVTVAMADDRAPEAGAAGPAALWMLVAGLAVTAISLLF